MIPTTTFVEQLVFLLILQHKIGLKKSCHFFAQSELKSKPRVSHPNMFSRASHQLHVFTSSFDWFTGLRCMWLAGVITLVLAYDTQLKTAQATTKTTMRTTLICTLSLKNYWLPRTTLEARWAREPKAKKSTSILRPVLLPQPLGDCNPINIKL